MKVETPTVKIGSVKIGGANPTAIQSMTNTNTEDAKKTASQCIELINTGAELVRITVNSEKAAKAVPEIRKILDDRCCSSTPLIGDFHFNGHTLLEKHPECAKALDKYRINPGNVGFKKNHDENFTKIIKIAIKNRKPVRIGVNSGSLDQELLANLMNKNSKLAKPKSPEDVLIDAMVKSAIDSAKYAEKLGMKQNQIVLSVKMSDVQHTIKAHELLTKKMSKHA
ncbi:flavodoxin-dependent (E)-4-hydroxy-3-methylbut-2-enyl-diphosphate synthase, partial [Candidatus Peregrinibacteria bacterium]|nr:flavodoxin-dependent (E)-4-hydroxy-3-methylbut-2-enyl-diphosphate synthase [Candidatus Peregrinibacteria bacterium]